MRLRRSLPILFYVFQCLSFLSFLFLRPLIVFVSTSSSFSNRSVMIILVFVSVGVCDSLMNDILTDNSVSVIITLILGIAISRIPSLSMVIDQIDDFIKIFLFLYISILSFNINIFCIDLKGKKKKKIMCYFNYCSIQHPATFFSPNIQKVRIAFVESGLGNCIHNDFTRRNRNFSLCCQQTKGESHFSFFFIFVYLLNFLF